MIFEDKSLKLKIFFGYFILIALLVAITGWSLYNFNNLSNSITDIMENNYKSIKSSDNMVESLERQDSGILMILNGQIEKGHNTFRNNEREFYKWFARAEDNITIEAEKGIIKSINEQYLKFTKLFDKFYQKNDLSQRNQLYNEKILPVFYEVKEKIRELRSVNQKKMVSAQEKANASADQATISTLIISMVSILMAILISLYISNQIMTPINKLKAAIKEVSNKNFKYKIEETGSSSEIKQLTTQFNRMIEKLQKYNRMNINKLKDEKNKSEAIVNNINNPLIVLDNENRIILLNQRSRELFDIKEDEGNKHFLELINNENLFNKIKETANGEESSGTNPVEIKNGKSRYYKVSTNSITTEQGDLKYTVVVLENITELKKVDDLKSEFVSTVSHEFRTPLTSMNMGLELILKENVGEINQDQKELLEATLEDTNRLNELVNDLLDLSKIESGRVEMNMDKTNVKNLVEKTAGLFEQQAQENEIELQIDDIPDDLYANADPNKISWVLSNLLGNALRYAQNGDYIKIAANKKGNRIYMSVEDNGKGIPEEYQDKIFEKFVRAGDEEEKKGSGLGLAIAKEIVEAHNGSIWVDSEEGEGSTFTFYLKEYK